MIFNYSFDDRCVMLCDRYWLQSQAKHILRLKLTVKLDTVKNWHHRLENSQAQVTLRKSTLPVITYPKALPVIQNRDEIKQLIQNNQVVILAGETGSGKTTQLPKMCMELGLAEQGLIGHTQPRRLAAQTIAQRISQELNCNLGEQVGYQVRFTDQSHKNSLLKLMTDGILLAEIKNDPLLLKYQTIIIDEAHERSLNIDFLLGYLKKILIKRSNLKLIITSATIDVELFSNHFNNAPIYTVSGRSYPIDTFYLDDDELDVDLSEQVLKTVKEIETYERNYKKDLGGTNILAFFSCERDIKDCALYLKKHGYNKDQIYPLYSRLAKQEQSKVFNRQSAHRKIILATNIAETSLTVPGVAYVIDSGKVRISRYNYRSKVQQLPIENISKASADQRQGRCGREGPGRCYRLYSKQTYDLMTEQTEVEILRTNLASVLLMSLDLKIGALQDFPFLQKPDQRYIKDAEKVLEEIQAINSKFKLTKLGRSISRLSVDPRLGRVVLAGEHLNCLSQAIVIATFITILDPREYPQERQEYARQMHARFNDKNHASDFKSILLLWCYYQEQQQLLSRNGLRKQFAKECLNTVRLREWQDLVNQLFQQMQKKYQKFTINDLNIDIVHRACLAGYVSHIARKDENKDYIGARNKRFMIFPGSSLYKKPPLWLVGAQLVETERLYARICAPIDPEWAFEYAAHLIKHQYSEPHWSKKHKQAMIFSSSFLYGLLLKDKERVSLNAIDPELAREIFIKEVFVNNTLADFIKPVPEFWNYNQKVIESIYELESKARRQDILVDDELLFQSYNRRLPSDLYEINGLKNWLKQGGKAAQQKLHLEKIELMQHSANKITGQQFPDHVNDGSLTFYLSYHFNPTDVDDGVSMIIPIEKLSQINDHRASWLVPGLLEEKCVALLKTLPKQERKILAPLPDLVHVILIEMPPPVGHLLDFLCYQIKQVKHLTINKSMFKLDKLDPYYLMNFKIIDQNRKLISQNRKLPILQSELKDLFESTINKSVAKVIENQAVFIDWTFDSLENAFDNKKIQNSDGLFPCLVSNKTGASLKLLGSPLHANYQTKKSLVIFLINKLNKEKNYILKNMFKSNEAVFVLAQESDLDTLKNNFLELVFQETFLIDSVLPKIKAEYNACIDKYKLDLSNKFQLYETALVQTLKLKQSLATELLKLKKFYSVSIADVELQLEKLFCDDYLKIAGKKLLDYPRYLKAISTRLVKLTTNSTKDSELMKQASVYENKLWQHTNQQYEQILISPSLNNFRFLLEEFRISLFDQTIKTREKVSLKRLETYWQKI